MRSRPRREQPQRHADADQDQKAGVAAGVADHVAGEEHGEKGDGGGADAADGRVFAAHRVGHKFLQPGVIGRLFDGAQNGEEGDAERHEPDDGAAAQPGRHPRRQNQQRGGQLAHGEEGDKGAFVAPARRKGRDHQRQDARKVNWREQQPNLRFIQPQPIQKEDEDRAKEGELDKEGVDGVGRHAPRQAAQLVDRGERRGERGGLRRRGRACRRLGLALCGVCHVYPCAGDAAENGCLGKINRELSAQAGTGAKSTARGWPYSGCIIVWGELSFDLVPRSSRLTK